jgi:cell division protein FtsL
MRRRIVALGFGAAALLAVALFLVKYEMRQLAAELAALESGLRSERETLRTLEAEWAYLNRPERLARLAADYLDLGRSDEVQFVEIEGLPLRPNFEMTGERHERSAAVQDMPLRSALMRLPPLAMGEAD